MDDKNEPAAPPRVPQGAIESTLATAATAVLIVAWLYWAVADALPVG